MRIFFANPRYSPDRWDGARIHISEVVSNLIALGHEVYTQPHHPVPGARTLSGGGLAKLRLLRTMDACYVRVDASRPVLPKWFQPPFRLLTRNVPIVWELNAAPDLDADKGEGAPHEERELVHRGLAKHTALAICNTDGLRRYAESLGIPRCTTVALASNPEKFSSRVVADPSYDNGPETCNILWCGNASISWHDFSSILGAAELLSARPEFRFFLACHALPESLSLPANVTVLNERPYEEMPSLMAAMDIGLAIYKNESWSRFGTFSSPLKVFDYLASGMTAVCSPIEQTKSLHQRNADSVRLVPFEDPQALATTIEEVFADRLGRDARRAAARDLVLTYYNWERVARETIEAIEGLSDD